ncbi:MULTISPECIES: hypothetical protein [Planktothrix]|uniref:Uncharacterized protein n=1 Tax=Planktothrix rubescens CCAP 1459/22 TaxID=329571 RepID=A0A6J7ZJ56_PLARU|nr:MULTISPECIES: hypothetical protein [Planktothrix]CAC5341894.1 hypothetical protein PLAN_150012 [Planktothrix rubescens NIVA-CYA 18]CAD5928489.1 hypothetical protein PCC7821_01119 [Planktothrix rubescens NIVA-CYA 18]
MDDKFPEKVAKESILAFVRGFFNELGAILVRVLFPFNVILGLGGKFLVSVTTVIAGFSALFVDAPDSNDDPGGFAALFVDAPDSNNDPDSNIGDI